jgi:gluconolactonase
MRQRTARTRAGALTGATVLIFLVAALPARQALLPGERAAVAPAIAGVVAAGATWQRAWSGFDNADGILGTPDGGLIFAQEQPSRVRKLDLRGNETVYVEHTQGGGSLTIDGRGRLIAVQRDEPTKIGVLLPVARTLATSFSDGKPLGRLNDLVATQEGGVYFTVGGAYYLSPDGKTSTVAADIRANGIMLSTDERTLYVTNGTTILAFDVHEDGSTTNRRDFGRLVGDAAGDGMAIDATGRLYVTAGYTVQVFSPQGQHLGVIPTPRSVISAAFAGAGKKVLYVVGHGAVGADGVERTERPAKTIYRVDMLAAGLFSRAK